MRLTIDVIKKRIEEEKLFKRNKKSIEVKILAGLLYYLGLSLRKLAYFFFQFKNWLKLLPSILQYNSGSCPYQITTLTIRYHTIKNSLTPFLSFNTNNKTSRTNLFCYILTL